MLMHRAKPFTWMDARSARVCLSPRVKVTPLEINALRYNAVRFAIDCARDAATGFFVKEWESLPETYIQIIPRDVLG